MKLCNTHIGNGIRDFHPVYFAMVMATGIMSIAFAAMDFPRIADVLFALNLIFYPILCTILIARVIFFFPNFIADLRTPRPALLFLTFVVGTNTLGLQLISFHQSAGMAIVLWFIALISWLACNYFVLNNYFSIQSKPSYKIVNGATLLVVVSTASVSLLGIRLLDAMGVQAVFAPIILGGLCLLGFVLYLIIITMLIYRLFFGHFELGEWEAPYWICMGAAAIISLAGSEFVIRMPSGEDTRDTFLWMTVFAWFLGSMWIPYLLFMDVRKLMCPGSNATSLPLWFRIIPWSRLAFGKQSYVYDPPSWSRVFPMGMYTASTLMLVKATGFEPLGIIAEYWGWFALLIWFFTLMGMLRSVFSSVRTFPTWSR